MGVVFLKKEGITYFHTTNLFQRYLFLRVWCEYLCPLFIYTKSITIICVSEKESSLIASKKQILLLQVNNF